MKATSPCPSLTRNDGPNSTPATPPGKRKCPQCENPVDALYGGALENGESAVLCGSCGERLFRSARDVRVMALLDNAGLTVRHGRDGPRTNAGWLVLLDDLKRCAGTGYLVALLGPRGCGKTQLAMDICRASCANLKPAAYTKAMRVFLAIRATYDKVGETEAEALERFLAPNLLIIDEVGVRGGSEFEDRLLTLIVDERYDSMKDTILIGNETEERLAKALGDSIMDRMRETGGIITCDWPSFR